MKPRKKAVAILIASAIFAMTGCASAPLDIDIFYQSKRFQLRDDGVDVCTAQIEMNRSGQVYFGKIKFDPHSPTSIRAYVSTDDESLRLTLMYDATGDAMGMGDAARRGYKYQTDSVDIPIDPTTRAVEIHVYWDAPEGNVWARPRIEWTYGTTPIL